jgi:hypothetical protein
MKLDGTEKLTHTPFDAHEQIVRGPHTHGKYGYQKAEAPKVPAPAPKRAPEQSAT